MTLINRLIKEANEGAVVLEVPENHVRSVAEHMRQHMWVGGQPTHEACEAGLRAGEVRLAGVPVKVVPRLSPDHQAAAFLRSRGHVVQPSEGAIPGLWCVNGGPELTAKQLLDLASRQP